MCELVSGSVPSTTAFGEPRGPAQEAARCSSDAAASRTCVAIIVHSEQINTPPMKIRTAVHAVIPSAVGTAMPKYAGGK